jgi:hypothetical protein
MTIGKSTGGQRRAVVRQTVTRTTELVHVASAAGGPEWLFERNPVDPRRASGQLIDHRAKTIVRYSDSDLDLMLGIPGWAHVLLLGCDGGPPEAGAAIGATRQLDGVTFVGRPNPRQAGALVWWNAEYVLPAECTRSDATGTSTVAVTSIRRAVDERLLRQPALRFPAYREVDLAEWLEGH